MARRSPRLPDLATFPSPGLCRAPTPSEAAGCQAIACEPGRPPSFRGARCGESGIQNSLATLYEELDSGFGAAHRPGMTGLFPRRLADELLEARELLLDEVDGRLLLEVELVAELLAGEGDHQLRPAEKQGGGRE